MDAIDRRTALRTLLCGAVAAGLATSLLTDVAEATPFAVQKNPGKDVEHFKQEVQGEARRPPGQPSVRPRPDRVPPHRRPPHHRRRRRHWECRWHRGRRRCAWRWR